MRDVDTPSEFLMQATAAIDDVEMVAIIRRHTDGSISFDTNTHSNIDMYALASAAANYSLARVVVVELQDS